MEQKGKLGFGSAQLAHCAVPARKKGKMLRSTKWLRDEARPCLHIAFPLTPEGSRGSWLIGGEDSLEEGYRTLEHWSGQGSDGQEPVFVEGLKDSNCRNAAVVKRG